MIESPRVGYKSLMTEEDWDRILICELFVHMWQMRRESLGLYLGKMLGRKRCIHEEAEEDRGYQRRGGGQERSEELNAAKMPSK